MIGRAGDLHDGDVLVTSDGTRWPIESVERTRQGIRLRVENMPFPWLFGTNEVVAFQVGE